MQYTLNRKEVENLLRRFSEDLIVDDGVIKLNPIDVHVIPMGKLDTMIKKPLLISVSLRMRSKIIELPLRCQLTDQNMANPSTLSLMDRINRMEDLLQNLTNQVEVIRTTITNLIDTLSGTRFDK